MRIQFSKKNKLFRLDTEHISYLIQVGPAGELRHIWYGATVDDDDMLLDLAVRRGKASFTPYPEGLSEPFAFDHLPLEYSAYGSGDLRITPAAIRKENGTSVTSTVYKSHKIIKGKAPLPGLPASFAPEKDSETLEITTIDGFSGAKIILSYSIFADSDVIARSVRIENATKEVINVEKVQSAQLDFHDRDYDMVYLEGRWAKERQTVRRAIDLGVQGFRSSRGSSGHQNNPGIVLAAKNATENCGDVYGMLLLYSSNYSVDVECDQYGGTRAMIGINPEGFGWKLEPGETFQAPEALLFFSPEGLGGLSRMSHKFIMDHVIRGPWKHIKRPILVNNWEATYFDFDDAKIYDIAKAASKVGIEMLVLDDGWFGKRNNDKTSLGDWFVNTKKLGNIASLVKKINKLGMKFGLWFEPEMISEESELYKKHPDWALCVPGCRRSIGRSQMVLDMSRKDVVDYLFETLSGVLRSANIEYIKWDMNRNMTEVYSRLLPADRQKETAHRYILGVYELHERILKAFPNLLIEGCSGGGGRFDAGMLHYTPQIWCSDDSDALERISIQMGTSLFYPSASMGAHVSVCPNHQTNRSVPFTTRGYVALAGTFGYELDLTKLSDEDRECVKQQVKDYHRFNDIIREGDFYRLTEGLGMTNISAWCWVSPDKKEVVVTAVRKMGEPCGHAAEIHLRIPGLDPKALYRFEDGRAMHGRSLMNAGFRLENLATDASAEMFYLKAK